jgi:hypothetical protein
MLKNVTKAKPFEPEVVTAKTAKVEKRPKNNTDIEPTELNDSDYELLQPK